MLEGEKKCTYSKKKFMASEVIKELKKNKQTNKTYCWFASDVMLVVLRCKNKSISLLWELNYLRKKIIVLTESRIDHQHGRLVTWLQAKNINHPPPAARLVPLEPPPQAFPRLSGEHTKAGRWWKRRARAGSPTKPRAPLAFLLRLNSATLASHVDQAGPALRTWERGCSRRLWMMG